MKPKAKVNDVLYIEYGQVVRHTMTASDAMDEALQWAQRSGNQELFNKIFSVKEELRKVVIQAFAASTVKV